MNRALKFKDLEPDDKKDMNISIAPYADSSFDTKFLEVEMAIQVAPVHTDSAAQTIWRYPKNAVTQYEPLVMEESEKQKFIESESLATFLKESLPQLVCIFPLYLVI